MQDLRESRWVDVASKHRSLLSYLYFLLNVSSGSDLTADQSVEATSLCKQVGGGVVFVLPETGAHRKQVGKVIGVKRCHARRSDRVQRETTLKN